MVQLLYLCHTLTHNKMNTTKELQTLTKFIQSTYTEMDLKIDEVKKQLKNLITEFQKYLKMHNK